MKFTAKFLLTREERISLIEREKAKVLQYGKRSSYPEMERLGFYDTSKYYDYLCDELKKLQELPAPVPSPVTQAPGFKAWFGKSKVVNDDGTPKVVYHGSGTEIEEFKYEFTGIGADQIGSGFYFSTDRKEADGYTSRSTGSQPKPGGEDKPTVHEVYLSIQHPLSTDVEKPLTYAQVRRLILMSPDLDDSLTNWGDVTFEGKEKVLSTAIESYVDSGETTVRALFPIANDFYGSNVEAFNTAVKKVLGYDGVVDDFGSKQHWVAFFPNQIKSVNSVKFDKKSPKITASEY